MIYVAAIGAILAAWVFFHMLAGERQRQLQGLEKVTVQTGFPQPDERRVS